MLYAIRAVAGLAAAGAVSADRDQRRLSGSSRPPGSVGIDSAAETVPGGNGEWAYVATDTGFVTVNISDPGSPTIEATRTVSEISGILDLDIEPETDRRCPGRRTAARWISNTPATTRRRRVSPPGSDSTGGAGRV